MKKRGLYQQFGLVFLGFAILSIVLNGAMTYFNQTEIYHQECAEDLRQITGHLAAMIEDEDDEFIYLKEYFKAHAKDLVISADFKNDLPHDRDAFLKYITDHYPGRTFGVDLHFPDLDEEARRLYVTWRFEYWFNIFSEVTDRYDLSYVYFIYADETRDHTMIYMFDPTIVTNDDGKKVFSVSDEPVYENPEDFKYMWDSWDNRKPSEDIDSVNNQYGYTYTFSYPVICGQEEVGLLCADASVYHVNNQILYSVIRQMLVTIISLALATAVLFYFLKNRIIDRVIRLEGNIASYIDNKDPEIAREIKEENSIDDEIGSLSEKFAGMIVDLDEYMIDLQKVTAEKERIGAELHVATQIQADMLPRIFPPFPNRHEFDLFATMTPAKEVGGDFYDFFLVDDDHLALVIADVSGKGVPAALFMVIAKTLIKNRVMMGEEPSVALSNVNEQLCEGNEAELFVTVWLAIVDLKTGHVLEANAGHEHPAVKKKDGVYEMHKTRHSPAVATLEGMRFRQTEFDLEPGDTIFVYTDGVTEATDLNNQLFGEDRLIEALNKNLDKEPAELLPAVRKEIDEFVGAAPQFDDITMLGLIFYDHEETDRHHDNDDEKERYGHRKTS